MPANEISRAGLKETLVQGVENGYSVFHMEGSQQGGNRKTVVVTAAVTFIGFLDTHLLIPIMAIYAAEIGASVGMIGLIIGLYSILNTPANIFFGRLIDRIGYKLPLIIGLIGDALGMFLYTLCRLPVHLVLVRLFHGASGGLVGPATMYIIADVSGEGKKGKAMSYYGMSIALATLVGYGASGIIVSRLGSKAVFYLGAVLLVISAFLSLLLPGSKRKVNEADRNSSGGIIKSISNLLKKKGLIVSYGTVFAQYFTFGGVVTLMPLYVKSLGMETFHVGMMLASFAVVFLLVQYPSGLLSDKIGRKIPIIGGLCVGTASLAVLPFLPSFPSLLAVMAGYGLAYGLLFPSVSAMVADYTDEEERGVASGMFHALLTAGVAVGAPVMGWVGQTVGIQMGLALTAVILLVALVVLGPVVKRV